MSDYGPYPHCTLTRPAIRRILEDPTLVDDSTVESITDWRSLEGRAELVRSAFHKMIPRREDCWIREVYEDAIVYLDGDDWYRQPYSVDDDGQVTFDAAEKVVVRVTYTTLAEAEAAGTAGAGIPQPLDLDSNATILEALDEGGNVWRITMVRPGISKNRRRYQPEVLREAASLYEGARAYDGHRVTTESRNSSALGGTNPLVGWHENVQVAEDGSLQSDFHIAESAPHVRSLFLSAWKSKRPDLIGFSHDVAAETVPVLIEGQRISDVRKIHEVHSVDVVASPSAGGRIERLVASRQDPQREEDNMTRDEFLRLLRAGELTDERIAEAIAATPELAGAYTEHLRESATPAEPTGTTRVSEGPEIVAGSLAHRAMVREALDSAPDGLPDAARDRIREALGTVTDEATMVRLVQETADIWSAALAAQPAQLPGQGQRITGGADRRAELGHALDGFFAGEPVEGVTPFRSLKEAYVAYTGHQPFSFDDGDFNRRILAEAIGCVANPNDRITESLTSASWAQALGDSITRRMVAEYRQDDYSSWRQIVSEVVPINDFRTNRRTRIGGYDVLPTVAEAGPYTALTSPADEEATYAIAKKGGTEDLTLETIANDDVGAVRRIPTKLGRAAALTLYRAIWNTTIAGNAVIYDAVALFAAGHNNENAATPLAEAGITTLRTKMIRQAEAGAANGYIGLRPRYIVVPPELWATAFKLANSSAAVVGAAESATTPNPHRGLTVIEVPTLTDVNDWYLIADPATVPTLEVGFYQGRQDPELLVQDQPAVGSVFSNDVITWKIRHIWGLTVLDYRGFQRATNV